MIENPDRYPVNASPVGLKAPRYLVLVARSEPSLYEYLCRGFGSDPAVEVVIDRRRSVQRQGDIQAQWMDRRGYGAWAVAIEHALALRGVAVIRPGQAVGPAPHPANLSNHDREERRLMDHIDVLDDRQRVDRWLEESQYLIGRLIPGYLDDRERLRGKLEGSEQECERLRQEVAELRKEIGALQGELQFHRNDQSAIAEAFAGIAEHLGQLQKPLEEVQRRLHSHYAMSGSGA